MSYGNDALMPDQAYSSAPMDPGLDGLGFIHPESFNQPNTENHGNTKLDVNHGNDYETALKRLLS